MTIGSHVFIAPHCIVTADVPSNTRVTVINQLQFGKYDSIKTPGRMRVVGAGVVGRRILVLGDGFGTPIAEMLDDDFQPCRSLTVHTALTAPNVLGVEITPRAGNEATMARVRHLRISDHGEDVVVLAPQGLAALLESKQLTTRTSQCA